MPRARSPQPRLLLAAAVLFLALLVCEGGRTLSSSSDSDSSSKQKKIYDKYKVIYDPTDEASWTLDGSSPVLSFTASAPLSAFADVLGEDAAIGRRLRQVAGDLSSSSYFTTLREEIADELNIFPEWVLFQNVRVVDGQVLYDTQVVLPAGFPEDEVSTVADRLSNPDAMNLSVEMNTVTDVTASTIATTQLFQQPEEELANGLVAEEPQQVTVSDPPQPAQAPAQASALPPAPASAPGLAPVPAENVPEAPEIDETQDVAVPAEDPTTGRTADETTAGAQDTAVPAEGPTTDQTAAEATAGAQDVAIPAEGPTAGQNVDETTAGAQDTAVPAEGPTNGQTADEATAGAQDVAMPAEGSTTGQTVEEASAGAQDVAVPAEDPTTDQTADETAAGAQDTAVPARDQTTDQTADETTARAQDVTVPAEGPTTGQTADEATAGAQDTAVPAGDQTADPTADEATAGAQDVAVPAGNPTTGQTADETTAGAADVAVPAEGPARGQTAEEAMAEKNAVGDGQQGGASGEVGTTLDTLSQDEAEAAEAAEEPSDDRGFPVAASIALGFAGLLLAVLVAFFTYKIMNKVPVTITPGKTSPAVSARVTPRAAPDASAAVTLRAPTAGPLPAIALPQPVGHPIACALSSGTSGMETPPGGSTSPAGKIPEDTQSPGSATTPWAAAAAAPAENVSVSSDTHSDGSFTSVLSQELAALTEDSDYTTPRELTARTATSDCTSPWDLTTRTATSGYATAQDLTARTATSGYATAQELTGRTVTSGYATPQEATGLTDRSGMDSPEAHKARSDRSGKSDPSCYGVAARAPAAPIREVTVDRPSAAAIQGTDFEAPNPLMAFSPQYSGGVPSGSSAAPATTLSAFQPILPMPPPPSRMSPEASVEIAKSEGGTQTGMGS